MELPRLRRLHPVAQRLLDQAQVLGHCAYAFATAHALHRPLLELGRIFLLRYLEHRFSFQSVEVIPHFLEDEISGEAHNSHHQGTKTPRETGFESCSLYFLVSWWFASRLVDVLQNENAIQ